MSGFRHLAQGSPTAVCVPASPFPLPFHRVETPRFTHSFTRSLIHSFTDEYSGCFPHWSITVNAAETLSCSGFREHGTSFPFRRGKKLIYLSFFLPWCAAFSTYVSQLFLKFILKRFVPLVSTVCDVAFVKLLFGCLLLVYRNIIAIVSYSLTEWVY